MHQVSTGQPPSSGDSRGAPLVVKASCTAPPRGLLCALPGRLATLATKVGRPFGPERPFSLYAANSVFEVSHWFDQCDVNSFERPRSRVLPVWLDEPTQGRRDAPQCPRAGVGRSRQDHQADSSHPGSPGRQGQTPQEGNREAPSRSSKNSTS